MTIYKETQELYEAIITGQKLKTHQDLVKLQEKLAGIIADVKKDKELKKHAKTLKAAYDSLGNVWREIGT